MTAESQKRRSSAFTEAEWRAFVAEYEAPLLGFFSRRAPNQADSVDLVQEVFIRLLRRGETSHIDDLRAYVFRVARSVLSDRRRRDAVRHAAAHEEFDSERHGGSDFSPERVYIDRQDIELMLIALNELPERTRDIFVLRAFEAMKYVDIAELLGVSVRAVEKQMAKALAHVGAHLGSDGT